jgi:hypothetical protein
MAIIHLSSGCDQDRRVACGDKQAGQLTATNQRGNEGICLRKAGVYSSIIG